MKSALVGIPKRSYCFEGSVSSDVSDQPYTKKPLKRNWFPPSGFVFIDSVQAARTPKPRPIKSKNMVQYRLSLYTAGTIAASQLLDLSNGNLVEVALNRVFERGSSNSKLNGRLGVIAIQRSIDQAAAEGIAAADAVHNVQMILLGEAVLVGSNIIQHGAPIVIESGFGLTQGDGNSLKTEFVGQLLGNALIAFAVELTGGDIGMSSLNAEYVLGVLLVGDADVNILAQLGHRSAGLVTGPEFAAVVQVAADLYAMGLGSFTGLFADLYYIGAQRGSDTGEMEPVNTLKDGIPIKISGGSFLDGTVSAVIDADGRR